MSKFNEAHNKLVSATKQTKMRNKMAKTKHGWIKIALGVVFATTSTFAVGNTIHADAQVQPSVVVTSTNTNDTSSSSQSGINADQNNEQSKNIDSDSRKNNNDDVNKNTDSKDSNDEKTTNNSKTAVTSADKDDNGQSDNNDSADNTKKDADNDKKSNETDIKPVDNNASADQNNEQSKNIDSDSQKNNNDDVNKNTDSNDSNNEKDKTQSNVTDNKNVQANVEQPQTNNEGGAWKFDTNSDVRTSPYGDGRTVAVYANGETLYYDYTVTINNVTWMVYKSANGEEHYVEEKGQNTFADQFFKTANGSYLSVDQQNFIKSLIPGAIQGWKQYGVLPSLTIAQAICESAWGTAAPGNNLFGIKGSYNGKSQLLWTWEWVGGQYVHVQDWFRAYDNVSESLMDHALFLVQNSRYHNLLWQTDAWTVVNLIREDGYATSPTYTSTLWNIIQSNNLTNVDQQAFSNWDVQNKSGSWTFSQGSDILTAPSFKDSQRIDWFRPGDTVYYNGLIYNDGMTWMRYQTTTGLTYYVAQWGYNTELGKPNIQSKNGSWTFSQWSDLNSNYYLNSYKVGLFNAGDTVNYDELITDNEGVTWMRIWKDGKPYYVAQWGYDLNSLKTDKTSGTWTMSQWSDVMSAPEQNGTNGSVQKLGLLSAGDVVNYDELITGKDGLTWMHTWINGKSCYIAQWGYDLNSLKTDKTSGTWTMSQWSDVMSAPEQNGTNGSVQKLGLLSAGDVVNYDELITGKDGLTWMRIWKDGKPCYVAQWGYDLNSLKTDKTSGTWTMSQWSDVMSAPEQNGTNGSVQKLGLLSAGDVVNYDEIITDQYGVRWMRIWKDGKPCYVAQWGYDLNSLKTDKTSGTWKFSQMSDITNAPAANGSVGGVTKVGLCNAGDTVNYDEIITGKDGLKWMRIWINNKPYYVAQWGYNAS